MLIVKQTKQIFEGKLVKIIFFYHYCPKNKPNVVVLAVLAFIDPTQVHENYFEC